MKLLLTRNELLVIDDKLTLLIGQTFAVDADEDQDSSLLLQGEVERNSLRGTHASAEVAANYELLMKVGRAIVDDQAETEINFDEDEIWILRELAQSALVVGSGASAERVGLNLKRKVYKALLAAEVEDLLEETKLKVNPSALDLKYNKGDSSS